MKYYVPNGNHRIIKFEYSYVSEKMFLIIIYNVLASMKFLYVIILSILCFKL